MATLREMDNSHREGWLCLIEVKSIEKPSLVIWLLSSLYLIGWPFNRPCSGSHLMGDLTRDLTVIGLLQGCAYCLPFWHWINGCKIHSFSLDDINCFLKLRNWELNNFAPESQIIYADDVATKLCFPFFLRKSPFFFHVSDRNLCLKHGQYGRVIVMCEWYIYILYEVAVISFWVQHLSYLFCLQRF